VSLAAPGAESGRKGGWERLSARLGRFMWPVLCSWLIGSPCCGRAAAPAEALFHAAADAYRAGDFSVSATEFGQAARLLPASGTLQNLGSAEWQRGQAGSAVLAWEQALWLDPFNRAARENLRYARRTAQLESPELTWYEVVSTWLPVHSWGWIAGISLWLAIGMAIVPGIFRFPKRAWQQAVAAFGFAVFLLCVPAHLGVDTRSRLGFVLEKNVPLRLTPTAEAEAITRLAAGEPARVQRVRGNYLLIQTSRARGWVTRNELGLTCPLPK
jgi:hypothetical protein